jgi:BetI-type transcriptional repressor, C-terminal
VARRRATKPTRASRPAHRRPPLGPLAVEERALPIVRELARVARSGEPPAIKLEGALEVLFGAYAEGDPHFSEALVGGWARAREDKQFRLTMAWLREQSRLSLEEILEEGVKTGGFRAGLDPGAVATAILGAAEGCLLQASSAGGTVAPARLVRALLALICDGPRVSGA